MIEKLILFFQKYITLNTEEVAFLTQNILTRDIQKNQMILSEGEVSKEFYFIIQGSIRLFYTTENGEKTAFFYFENQFVSSYKSFTSQVPSTHNLQVTEDSVVAVVSFETAHKLLEHYPKFEFLARVMMEEELIVCQEIISSFITMNAEERYKKLLAEHRQWLQRIPQHQIATFLGVTPETLSRIRKRISL